MIGTIVNYRIIEYDEIGWIVSKLPFSILPKAAAATEPFTLCYTGNRLPNVRPKVIVKNSAVR